MWSACTLPPHGLSSCLGGHALQRSLCDAGAVSPFPPGRSLCCCARSCARCSRAWASLLARPAVLVGVSTALCRAKLGVSCCAAAGAPPAGISLSAVDAGRGEARPPAERLARQPA